MAPDVSDDVALVQELVAAVPELEELYEVHVFNQHGTLPHIFFWDMTQDVLASYQEDDGPDALWRQTLAFLERRFGGSREADAVIGTSFLYSLPWPGQPGYGIVEELGPTLRRVFSEVRPGG